MIVCHCNVLRCTEVRRAICAARGEDGLGITTPGAIFKQLGHRPNCGNCMPNLHRLIFEEANAAPSSASKKSAD